MQFSMGNYGGQDRFESASETARQFIQTMNDDRAYANHAADLDNAARDAAANGDDLMAEDIAMRADYAERAREAASAHRNTQRMDDSEDREEAMRLRDEQIDYLEQLREQHEAFRQRAQEAGRTFNAIEEKQPETVERDRHMEQDATPAPQARPAPQHGRRRGWDAAAEQPQQAAGEAFGDRLRRMQAERNATPAPRREEPQALSLREQFEQLERPSEKSRAATYTHAAISGAIAHHDAQPDPQLAKSIEIVMQGYRERSMSGLERSQALVDVAAADLHREQGQEPQAPKLTGDPGHDATLEDSHERAYEAWDAALVHARDFHEQSQRFAATERDRLMERAATPAPEAQASPARQVEELSERFQNLPEPTTPQSRKVHAALSDAIELARNPSSTVVDYGGRQGNLTSEITYSNADKLPAAIEKTMAAYEAGSFKSADDLKALETVAEASSWSRDRDFYDAHDRYQTGQREDAPNAKPMEEASEFAGEVGKMREQREAFDARPPGFNDRLAQLDRLAQENAARQTQEARPGPRMR